MNLSKMSINDKRLLDCFEHIQINRQLKSLNFSHNQITTKGFSALLKIIGKHPTLEILYLNNNYLDSDSIALIRKRVGKLGKLRYIGLRNNQHISNVEQFKDVIHFLKKKKIRLDLK